MEINRLVSTYLKCESGEFKLKAEFNRLNSNRETMITNCEKYAAWTLPIICPRDELHNDDELQYDYQSIGAQAVINLVNKMMMTLFHPSRPFFRMNLTDEQLEEVKTTGKTDAEIEAQLAESERAAMREMDTLRTRPTLTEVIKHLVITGNALLALPEGEDTRPHMYGIKDYVVQRDLRGNVVKIIIRETKAVEALSDDLCAIVKTHNYEDRQDVTLYTGIHRTGEKTYIVWQELEDLAYCHKRVGQYKAEDLPWIPLTWSLSKGKDYGTGLVEAYGGAFHTLSTLSEGIMDYTTLVTDVKYLVNPAGSTDVAELNRTPSGQFVHGREEDIFVLFAQVAHQGDFLDKQFERTARQIGVGFLLSSAVTRNAERVTAEEIRQQAQELEGALGGTYSLLGVELQIPLARYLVGRLDPVFKNVKPTIITGLESLTRTSDLDRLRYFFQDLIVLAEVPEEVRVRMDYDNIIAMLGAGHGVAYEKVLKDKKVVKQEQAQNIAMNAQAAGMEAGAVANAEAQVQGKQNV